jgi:hypothetical protein
MKRPWPIYAFGIALVIVLAYVKGRVVRRKVEHFAIFGPKKMPYSQLITGMFTPKELKEWQKNIWDKMTLDEKNVAINVWDSQSADDQNKQYNALLSQKNTRLEIENAGGGGANPAQTS